MRRLLELKQIAALAPQEADGLAVLGRHDRKHDVSTFRHDINVFPTNMFRVFFPNGIEVFFFNTLMNLLCILNVYFECVFSFCLFFLPPFRMFGSRCFGCFGPFLVENCIKSSVSGTFSCASTHHQNIINMITYNYLTVSSWSPLTFSFVTLTSRFVFFLHFSFFAGSFHIISLLLGVFQDLLQDLSGWHACEKLVTRRRSLRNVDLVDFAP